MNIDNLVSVIIPTYNRDYCIKETVNAVLKQTYKNIEIIVVDDGSTDETKKTLEEYIRENKIKYIYTPHSGRPAVARNVGIKNSTGEYIAFLDSDDSLDENSIFKRIYALKKYERFGLVFTDFSCFKNNGKGLFKVHELPIHHYKIMDKVIENFSNTLIGEDYIIKKESIYELILYCFIWIGAVMVKKSLLKEIGRFDEKLVGTEDHDLWIRILSKTDVLYLNKKLSYYRIQQGSLSEISKTFLTNQITVRKKYLKILSPKAIYKKKIKKQLAKFYFAKGYILKKENSNREAIINHFNAIKYYPLKLKYYKALIVNLFF